MVWSWERVVALNKLICEASGQPHAIREDMTAVWNEYSEAIRPDTIANKHPFVEGNKRTAACVAICLTLEGV